MINIQALLDGLSQEGQRERADSQMTLGTLIDHIKRLPEDLQINGLCSPHSYRGYYIDLAFEGSTEKMRVSEVLEMCRQCMGRVFIGYKGGDFVMGELTPVWVAPYGITGLRIISIDKGGNFDLQPEDNG